MSLALEPWWRHEQLSVAAALATVTHHSFQVGTKHDGARRLSPALVGSCRRLLRMWPSRREGQSRTGTWLPPVPSLAVSLLAGAAGEAVDDTALLPLPEVAFREEEGGGGGGRRRRSRKGKGGRNMPMRRLSFGRYSHCRVGAAPLNRKLGSRQSSSPPLGRGRGRRGGRGRCRNPTLHSPLVYGHVDVGMDALSLRGSVFMCSSPYCRSCRFLSTVAVVCAWLVLLVLLPSLCSFLLYNVQATVILLNFLLVHNGQDAEDLGPDDNKEEHSADSIIASKTALADSRRVSALSGRNPVSRHNGHEHKFAQALHL